MVALYLVRSRDVYVDGFTSPSTYLRLNLIIYLKEYLTVRPTNQLSPPSVKPTAPLADGGRTRRGPELTRIRSKSMTSTSQSEAINNKIDSVCKWRGNETPACRLLVLTSKHFVPFTDSTRKKWREKADDYKRSAFSLGI